MDSGNGHLAALYDTPVITLWGVTHPYAGFVPFNQPNTNQLIADRTQYPLIPTSVYGNSYPRGYEKAITTIPPSLVVEKVLSVL
jgi:ADP-heptose:LPS heptosyltransferase